MRLLTLRSTAKSGRHSQETLASLRSEGPWASEGRTAPDSRRERQTTEELRGRTYVPCPEATDSVPGPRRDHQAGDIAPGAGIRATHHAMVRGAGRPPPCSRNTRGRT